MPSDLLDRLTAAIDRGNAIGRRGIYARTHLPSPTYDHLFCLRRVGDRTLCVMVPGTRAYDKHWFEEVPL